MFKEGLASPVFVQFPTPDIPPNLVFSILFASPVRCQMVLWTKDILTGMPATLRQVGFFMVLC